MCLILLAYRCRTNLPLMVLANRDEYLARESAPVAAWPEHPEVFGGRDLVAGGSWLGCRGDGRWAAVTNVREGEKSPAGTPSRGWLVRDYLAGTATAADFAGRACSEGVRYAGFNLLLGDARELWYASNRTGARRLAPGLYGLSNGTLDVPWPKVARGKAALTALLAASRPDPADGFRLLADRETFPDDRLPETGIPRAWERILSATFIVAPGHGYGTRSSTLLLQTGQGRTLLTERTFAGDPGCWSQRSFLLAAGDPGPGERSSP